MARTRVDGPEVGAEGRITRHVTIGDNRSAEAIDWCKQAFDAEEQMRPPTKDGRLMHAHLKINGGSLMLHDEFSGPNGWTLAAAGERGASPQPGSERSTPASETGREPRDEFWGDRYGEVRTHSGSSGA